MIRMSVRVIKASKGCVNARHDGRSRLRVAAYCRVSTDMEEQETSYEAQCQHYSSFIRSKPGWKLAGIFADEGISGTSTKGRAQFHSMIAACERGEIDMIITKSISRFARNTLDCLTYIRKLKALGIPIYFEKENINTMDTNGELLLTILASIAQQESQSISQNVRMGIQFRMQEGIGRLDTTRFLGLTKVDGELKIVPEEAEIIRRIYREYLEGFSPERIAKRLEADGVESPAHGARWYPSTVANILQNEKYCGDNLLQKYYIEDFLTHKVIKNAGQLPQYYVENNHAPIIPKQVYLQVQGERMRRAAIKNIPKEIRMGAMNAFTGRLICGRCNRSLKRISRSGSHDPDWRCRARTGREKRRHREAKSACGCRFVPELQARQVVVYAFNQLSYHRDALMRLQAESVDDIHRVDGEIQKNRQAQACLEEGTDRELARLREEERTLLLKRADLCHAEVQIRLLLEFAEVIGVVSPVRDPVSENPEAYPACYDADEFFFRTRYRLPRGSRNGDGRLIAFDNDLVVRYISQIIVTDDGFDVYFKAGITIHIPLEDIS